MLRLSDIIEKVQSYHPNADIDLIKKAYVYSAKAHQGQVRKSGEPYLVHPLEVCGLLADMRLDEHCICAGILHDTVEDTQTTVEELEQLFGKQVAEIVDGVTKLSNIPYNTAYEKHAENFRRMLVAMAKDIRVILVKLADRLHNMRTLDHMAPHKQEKIAKETLEIYAPLANRLGIYWMKAALEDLCLRYLHPKDWEEISQKLTSNAKVHAGWIEEIRSTLQKKMEEGGVPCEVHGRIKHTYSIWRKLKSQGIEFDQVHDIIAFRVITDNIAHCYQALGLCHAAWRPVPGRFKDLIAMPKPNGYKSLHTTVIGPDVQRVEIQIRTNDMHDVAELGIAAHWAYKEGKPDTQDDQFGWLRQLMEWQKELTDPTDFIATVKVDLFSDEVYVFTPKGEVRELKRGSTPVDFAYLIHTEIGHHCVGARVNGRIVPLRYRLKNGDTVEIMTSPTQRPNKDWLNFVQTARARARINAYLRKEQRRRAIGLGKEILDREFKRYGKSLQKLLKNGELERAVANTKYVKVDDVLAAVGYGKVKAVDIVHRVLPKEVIDKGPKEETKPKTRLGQLIEAVAKKSKSGVTVQGIDEMLVRFAKCCSPVPGDPIVGFVTRGRGITVHAMNCSKALTLDPERKVDVNWDSKTTVPRSVQLKVITDDKPGILATMSQAFSGAGVNILNANCRARKDSRAVNMFMVTIKDTQQLHNVMKAIENLAGVHSVERVGA
jgi:GTP diphosphokinase / guanosine-3',5'-bis(diphosphate) 3'-diphosphatase